MYKLTCIVMAACIGLFGCQQQTSLNSQMCPLKSARGGCGSLGCCGEPALIEQIENVDDGYQEIRISNSIVVIRTHAIDRIVQQGLPAMPALIRLLKEETLSFDLFVRSYSAAEQILYNADPQSRVLWSGGCEIKREKTGIERCLPGGQIDLTRFRHLVAISMEQEFERTNSSRNGMKK